MSIFPEILSLKQIEPYIADCPHFVKCGGEDTALTFIDYVVQAEDTFPPIEGDEESKTEAMIRRECRGIAFCNATGRLRSRPLHKFFNLNERPETLFDVIDWTRPHYVMTKMDGSMVRPVVGQNTGHGGVRWATRKGITDVACEVELFCSYAENRAYEMAGEDLIDRGFTPVFEFVSPGNRIVLKYDRPQLVLLAVRELRNGTYMSYRQLRHEAERHGIELVPQYASAKITPDFIARLQEQEGVEGVVVRFENGLTLKIKTSWYAQLHKIRSLLSNEREVVRMVLEDKLDDALGMLPDELRRGLSGYRDRVIQELHAYGDDIAGQRMGIRGLDRKEFAIRLAPKLHPFRKAITFAAWGKGDAELDALIRGMLLKKLGSNRSFATVRDEVLRDLPVWNYGMEE